MMRHLPFIISLVAGLLWVVVVKLSCKILGIPWPTRFQRREGVFRTLSSNQYACLFGSLSWGFGMFLCFAVDDYLQTAFDNPASRSSIAWVAFELVWWLAAGCVFGWMMWGGNRQLDAPVK
jgi:hypothetical protein